MSNDSKKNKQRSQIATMNRIVSTLLLELDKCNNDNSCFIFNIGATNRPDLLHLGCMIDEECIITLKICEEIYI